MRDEGITDKLARQIERFVWKTPSGASRASLPWDALGTFERAKLPLLLRPKPQLGASLLVIGLTLTFFGFVSRSHGSFAIGVGMTFVSVRAFLLAWRRIGELNVTVSSYSQSVGEGGDVELVLDVMPRSQEVIPRLTVYAVFSGAVEADGYVLDTDIKPHFRHRIRLSWRADVGMGTFHIQSLKLITADDLGIFPIAIDLAAKLEVVVAANVRPIEHFPMRESGSTTDAGAFEARGTGDAVSFRGLRPWRVGDGMRRIDWKRSQRVGALLVKEFERIASTSAALFFDLCSDHQSQYGGISTFNALRGSALELTDWLLQNRIKTTFVAADLNLPLSAGRDDEIFFREIMRDLRLQDGASITTVLDQHLGLLEPDSLVVIFACAANVHLDQLWNSLITCDERRIEVVLVLVDTAQFVHSIHRQIRLEKSERPFVKMLVTEITATSRGALGKVAAKLLARTYVLGPDSSLAELAEGSHL